MKTCCFSHLQLIIDIIANNLCSRQKSLMSAYWLWLILCLCCVQVRCDQSCRGNTCVWCLGGGGGNIREQMWSRHRSTVHVTGQVSSISKEVCHINHYIWIFFQNFYYPFIDECTSNFLSFINLIYFMYLESLIVCKIISLIRIYY